MTDDEKLKLYEDLVRARRSLSETRLLHRPIQDKDSSFFKNTLRRYTFTFIFVGAGVDGPPRLFHSECLYLRETWLMGYKTFLHAQLN